MGSGVEDTIPLVNAMMPKKAVVMTRVVPLGLLLLASLRITPVLAGIWCEPILTKAVGIDDYAVVPTELVRVVRPELQDKMQGLLADRSVVTQSASEAARLLKTGEGLPDASHYFLVRASAYDVDSNYTVASNLTVYFSPSRGEVELWTSHWAMVDRRRTWRSWLVCQDRPRCRGRPVRSSCNTVKAPFNDACESTLISWSGRPYEVWIFNRP